MKVYEDSMLLYAEVVCRNEVQVWRIFLLPIDWFNNWLTNLPAPMLAELDNFIYSCMMSNYLQWVYQKLSNLIRTLQYCIVLYCIVHIIPIGVLVLLQYLPRYLNKLLPYTCEFRTISIFVCTLQKKLDLASSRMITSHYHFWTGFQIFVSANISNTWSSFLPK